MQLYDLTLKGEDYLDNVLPSLDLQEGPEPGSTRGPEQSRLRGILLRIKYAGTAGSKWSKVLNYFERNGYIEAVRSRPDLELYHVTPTSNVPSIKTIGLDPKRAGQETGATPVGVYLFATKKGGSIKPVWDDMLGEEVRQGTEEDKWTAFRLKSSRRPKLEGDPDWGLASPGYREGISMTTPETIKPKHLQELDTKTLREWYPEGLIED